MSDIKANVIVEEVKPKPVGRINEDYTTIVFVIVTDSIGGDTVTPDCTLGYILSRVGIEKASNKKTSISKKIQMWDECKSNGARKLDDGVYINVATDDASKEWTDSPRWSLSEPIVEIDDEICANIVYMGMHYHYNATNNDVTNHQGDDDDDDDDV